MWVFYEQARCLFHKELISCGTGILPVADSGTGILPVADNGATYDL
ncbi:hypothetical protein [Tychonema bourrellyi]|nr:hypothetical protein [Tychonema bourrellyi]